MIRGTPPNQPRVRPAHESKSATVRAAAAAPSRRQQSRWQREQQQQRTLFIAIGVLVVLVAAIFAGGFFYENVAQANQVIAQVGPDSITASQLLDEVRPQARAIDAQAQQFGGAGNTNIASYVDQQKRTLPDQVLNTMIDADLLQQEATRRGISITPAEVDDKERQTVADYQASLNPAPTPSAAPSTEATVVPEAAGTPALTSATPGTSPSATAAPTTPTAVPTLDASAYAPALQQLLDKSSLTEDQFRTQLQQSLLRDKVQAAIGEEQEPAVQEQIHARQIVVRSSDQANSLLSQLQGGADFAQLAQQNSADTATKDQAGDMGWFPRGVQSAAFDNAAFALDAGQLSGVVQDGGQYRIIQVLEKDPARPVPDSQLTTLRQKAFDDWLSSQRSGQNVKIQLGQSETNWILTRIGVRP